MGLTCATWDLCCLIQDLCMANWWGNNGNSERHYFGVLQSEGTFPTQRSNPLLMSPVLADRLFTNCATWFSSVQFSSSVVSDSLQPHGLQHARDPCPWPTPGVYSNSCPLSQWWHPTSLSSVVTFSSCLQSFPATGSFLFSQLFTSDGQSIGFSASVSVLPVNIWGWFSLELTGLIPWQLRDSRESSPQFKSMDCLTLSLLYGLDLTSIHDY